MAQNNQKKKKNPGNCQAFNDYFNHFYKKKVSKENKSIYYRGDR